MKELNERIYNTISTIIDVNLSEADTESFPYAIYSTKVSDLRCKTGVYAKNISLKIDVVGDKFNICQEKGDDIYAALVEQFTTQDSVITLTNSEHNSTYGLWNLIYEFQIIKNI